MEKEGQEDKKREEGGKVREEIEEGDSSLWAVVQVLSRPKSVAPTLALVSQRTLAGDYLPLNLQGGRLSECLTLYTKTQWALTAHDPFTLQLSVQTWFPAVINVAGLQGSIPDLLRKEWGLWATLCCSGWIDVGTEASLGLELQFSCRVRHNPQVSDRPWRCGQKCKLNCFFL